MKAVIKIARAMGRLFDILSHIFIQEAVWFLSNITAGNRIQVQV